MTRIVLAGDIGGTKTNLALYDVDALGSYRALREDSFPSEKFTGLESVVQQFLAAGSETVAAAAFGVAGPVFDGVVQATNLPWEVTAAGLADVTSCEQIRLMNDLETTAFGALFLRSEELETLNEGTPRVGHMAVIAAGTGLGQAYLYFDGERHHAVATEGGHIDFPARDELEFGLLRFLQRQFDRVSYERVLSGPGLVNIFRYLDREVGRPVADDVRKRLTVEDPAAVIGSVGLAGGCATCAEAVNLFVGFYGAQAGNLALTINATGGVFIGGGIVVKLLDKIREGRFLENFVAKGRYRQFMREIPVHVILNPKAAMVGAANAAAEML